MPDDNLTQIYSDWTEIPGEFHWKCRAFQEARIVIEDTGEARIEIRCAVCQKTEVYPLTFSAMPWEKDAPNVNVS